MNQEVTTIFKHFPNLTEKQKTQFTQLGPIYQEWNEKINLISRKDIENFYTRHVLHSLGIAKVMEFEPGTKILDLGTGGGFPGIPLAILYPKVAFHLVDSIGKKINVVRDVYKRLGLSNVEAEQVRAEDLVRRYDFIVARAVTQMSNFYPWVKDKFKREDINEFPNGIFYLKGGDVDEEMEDLHVSYVTYHLEDYFSDPFFEMKKVIYMPYEGKR